MEIRGDWEPIELEAVRYPIAEVTLRGRGDEDDEEGSSESSSSPFTLQLRTLEVRRVEMR